MTKILSAEYFRHKNSSQKGNGTHLNKPKVNDGLIENHFAFFRNVYLTLITFGPKRIEKD